MACQAGDYVVCEAPTYYLCHQMFRERGLNLLEARPLIPFSCSPLCSTCSSHRIALLTYHFPRSIAASCRAAGGLHRHHMGSVHR